MAENSEQNQEDKQLDPTERRLQKAREEGQFAQSRDLTTLIVLLLFTAFVLGLGNSLMRSLVQVMEEGLALASLRDWQAHLLEWLAGPVLSLTLWLLALALPVWLISAAAPLALVKFRPVWALKWKLEQLDPVAGLGRMFSMQTLAEVGKNILKVAFVFGVGVVYLVGLFGQLNILAHQDMKPALVNTMDLLKQGLLLLLLPIVVVAIVDVFLQLFNFRKRMRMSPEELKQELKETEGSPELKARLRMRQRQIATSRMMAALEKADVVLANPDHYSVALRYDADKMMAPIVVAKGVDELALRMQALAQEHQVPVARIPPLARMLHQHLRVGEPIPAALFEAVAKVLAWAYELRESGRKADESSLPDIGTLPTAEVLRPRG